MTITEMPRGGGALELFLRLPVAGPVLDIGSGHGHHADIMKQHGFDVVTLDSYWPADVMGAWPRSAPRCGGKYGGIWACHVLEHSRNPGAFLDACHWALQPEGWLCVTVPPAKHNIVGGHVTLWNAGLVLYNLILSGFDCRNAKIKNYGYNISVIVQKTTAFEMPHLFNDEGDIEILAQYFPIPAAQGFNGNAINDINWFVK